MQSGLISFLYVTLIFQIHCHKSGSNDITTDADDAREQRVAVHGGEVAEPKKLGSNDQQPLARNVHISSIFPNEPLSGGDTDVASAEESNYRSTQFWLCVVGAIFMIVFSGFCSGMTVGFLSSDPVQLKVLATNGTSIEKKRAQDVSSLIQRHHLLLVTLLLGNTLATESLPVFLDRLMPSWAAVLFSVTAILFFGEVLPQAYCTGPNQLKVAAAMVPLVRVLVVILFVICWPMSKALDFVLGGHERSLYTRPHLKALIRMHQTADAPHADKKEVSSLGVDEVVVIEGALDMANKILEQIMIPVESVKMIEWNTKLTEAVMKEIVRLGHSRIPIYRGSRHNIRGLLLVKSLILVDPKQGVKAHELIQSKPPLFEAADQNLYNMLNEFQKGSSHMAFITHDADLYKQSMSTGADVAPGAKILGVATMEDVIEELIQEEIYDEFDTQAAVPTCRASCQDLSRRRRTVKPFRRSMFA